MLNSHDERLKARLRRKAEGAGKKIMCLGPEGLAKIVAFVSQSNDIAIGDL